MNQQQFSELVREPAALGGDTVSGLEDLLKQFPYCQTAQVLLALNLQKQNAAAYQAQLKKAIAYAGDRKKLKELLEWRTPVAAPLAKPTEALTAPEAVEAAAPAVIETPAPAVEITVPASQPEPPRENFIEDSVVSFEELAIAPPPEPVKAADERDIAAPLRPLTKPSAVPKEKVSQEDLLAIVRKRLAEISEEKGRGTAEQDESPRLKETVADEVMQPQLSIPAVSKSEIIERFIREEPQISRPKKEFFSPAASSQRSNMDEEDIVSETLALLYAKQGNMQKAIHIYEKLSLRFSEKSRYFAAQIENLKGNQQQSR